MKTVVVTFLIFIVRE